MSDLDAGKPWSEDVPVYCGVTRDQYPDPRPCLGGIALVPPMPKWDGLCHLGHPYNCRLFLKDNGIDWRTESPAS